jgi:hypothetical protein
VRRVTLLTVPVLALSLAACGGSGPNPGVAMRLGDLQVTTRHVDDLVSDYCSVVSKEQQGTPTTLQDARNSVVSSLSARMVAERFAEVKGIQPDQSYDTAVAQLRSQLSAYDEDTQDALIEIAGAQSYVSSVIGQADQQVFTDWIAQQHVTINPVYGVTLTKDQFALVDPSISLAVSSLAKASVKSASDPSASPAPGARTCG